MKNDLSVNINEEYFLEEAKSIVVRGRGNAYSAINSTMIETYWQLGKVIVEQEQQGKERADYGTFLLKLLSVELTKEFGKGFTERNLRNFRQFYQSFPDAEIRHTRVPNLTWSHIRLLLKVHNEQSRLWYMNEASAEMWSVRTLDRNIGSQYYERMLLSQHKDIVKHEMRQKTEVFQNDKLEFIKKPVVAEFLGLSPNTDFTETDLENAILSNIQKFIMELGRGFAFVARQQHIKTDEADYFIDLVFYNYILKCFVLIDLKTTKISYQDVGQMDMYLQMYDELKRSEGDAPTIGIILCSDTNEDVAKYSTLAKNEQMFASKYMVYLPSQDELRHEIERQKLIFKLQR